MWLKNKSKIVNIKPVLLFIMLINLGSNFAQSYKLKTVVLDAGHGGHDSGCKGHSGSSFEKNVTLDIILSLGKLIENNYPDVKVVYTRKTDVFIPLEDRAQIANKNNADIFISVHCNANANTSAYGTETFLMGLHKTEANLDVALRENAVIKLEKDYKDKYEGFDPDAPEALIAMSLAQNANIEQSSLLAGKVQNYFTNNLNRYNRGVKQAGFWVLYRTACPSILIETGFLTNYTEEKYLTSEKGQQEMANAIFHAFEDYKKYMEKGTSFVTPTNNNTSNEVQIEKVEVTPKPKESTIIEEQPKVEPKLLTTTIATSKEENKPTYESINDIIYKVQLKASGVLLSKSNKIYTVLPYIHYEQSNGLYKYLGAPCDTYSKALNQLKIVKQKGYTDAFIVVYKNGKRLSFQDAKQYFK